MARKFANAPVAALVSLAWMTLAPAAECPRKGTLGTSRILRVDVATYPRVGLKNYPQTIAYVDKLLALGDKIAPVRLQALVARATVFYAGSSDKALQTPEQFTKARDAELSPRALDLKRQIAKKQAPAS